MNGQANLTLMVVIIHTLTKNDQKNVNLNATYMNRSELCILQLETNALRDVLTKWRD